MKIICPKCHNNISTHVYEEMEKNTPTSVICPICGSEQKRYLSEADFHIYLSFMEATYFLLSFITALLLNFIGFNVVFGIMAFALFIGAIIITNRFKYEIYEKGLFKKETMYIKQNVNSKNISRSLRWQFILFFALVITFVTEFDNPNMFWAFVLLSLAAIFFSIFRTKLAIKKEKEELLNH